MNISRSAFSECAILAVTDCSSIIYRRDERIEFRVGSYPYFRLLFIGSVAPYGKAHGSYYSERKGEWVSLAKCNHLWSTSL